MTYVHHNFPRCPDTGKPILEISHSGLNTFNSCPKKWAWRKAVVQNNSTREESDATACGSALHEGLQDYLTHKNVDRAIATMAMRHPIELRDPSTASKYSLAASVTTMMNVINSGELDKWELAKFDVGGVLRPAIEVPALVVIETPHLVFHLRQFIDAVLFNYVSGHFFAIDIKTTTPQGIAHFEEKYKYDWQVTSYGIPLAGLLGVSENFDVGILGVIQDHRSPTFTFPKWTRTKHDVDAYYHWLMEAVIRIQRMWLSGLFVRQPTACVGYGKLCPFFASCGVDSLRDMQMLANPSGDPGDPGRPFEPFYTAKLEIE